MLPAGGVRRQAGTSRNGPSFLINARTRRAVSRTCGERETGKGGRTLDVWATLSRRGAPPDRLYLARRTFAGTSQRSCRDAQKTDDGATVTRERDGCGIGGADTPRDARRLVAGGARRRGTGRG